MRNKTEQSGIWVGGRISDKDNELLFAFMGGWRGKAYLWIAAATFVRQTVPRLQACEGLLGCGLSIVKCTIWSLARGLLTDIELP
jgi:hypothetical protein